VVKLAVANRGHQDLNWFGQPRVRFPADALNDIDPPVDATFCHFALCLDAGLWAKTGKLSVKPRTSREGFEQGRGEISNVWLIFVLSDILFLLVLAGDIVSWNIVSAVGRTEKGSQLDSGSAESSILLPKERL
jgi:hypothetical protein